MTRKGPRRIPISSDRELKVEASPDRRGSQVEGKKSKCGATWYPPKSQKKSKTSTLRGECFQAERKGFRMSQ